MDQLENQVSDLRHFLTSTPQPPPLPVSPAGSGGGSSHHAVTPSLSMIETPSHPQGPFAGAAAAAYSPGGPQHPPPHPAPSLPPPPSMLGDNSALHRDHNHHHHQHMQHQHQDQHQHQHQHQHQRYQSQYYHSPDPAGSGAASGNAKRKTAEEENAAKQQRKRTRYTSIACNECKRRKIKCNGQTPCQRCGNLALQCLYEPNCCSHDFKETEEYKRMTEQINRLQDQLNGLVSNVEALRQQQQDILRKTPSHDRVLPPPPAMAASYPSSTSLPASAPRSPGGLAPRVLPSFSGPTSMTYTVDIAKDTLHRMGYTANPDGAEEDERPAAVSSISPRMRPDTARSTSRMGTTDPLWQFDKDEMVRLCRVHEEEVGIMYPVIDIQDVIDHAKSLATWMEARRKEGLLSPALMQEDVFTDLKTCTLKIIMCCALSVEEHSNSAKALQLYESMRDIVERKLMDDPADVANLPFLALVAGYRFLSNDEILAWRVMGQVARLCLELGLHRRDGLQRIPDEQSRRSAINTFWSAYILDRRWSFGTGLPYVCHDDKIDPKLPMPDNHPFLVAMITYSRLAAKIWRLIDYFEPAIIRELKQQDFEKLDAEILEWYESVPEQIKVPSLNSAVPLVPAPSSGSYDIQRLQVWTRLRLNQMRIWLHTPVLHSASSIAANPTLAQRAVDLAKDTIGYLARLNDASNMYRRIQVFYHQFLTSAIAVLFLASTHAPLQFSANCRVEFYMAVDLVKDMSARSWVSQRLWRTIRSLKAFAPQLGLEEYGPGSANGAPPHPASAAAAAVGLNGAAVGPGGGAGDGYKGVGGAPSLRTPTVLASDAARVAQQQRIEDVTNGLKLQTEMARVFGGFMDRKAREPRSHSHPHAMSSPQSQQQQQQSPLVGDVHIASSASASPDDGSNVLMYETLKDLF
ncbi:hypothetical protein VTK73DRAFT_288 [Phialemonium thermophilum]|uniref:Zn(2)-C6 fungal-type domain-containing protein n=1 Tax=Phialemonium thermophilum TaxID=223376 RepID=A0ABR3VVX6_9PEZI